MLRNKTKTIIALITLIILSTYGFLYFNGIWKINFQTKDHQIETIISSALSSTMSNSFEDSISILNDGLKKFPDNKKIIEMKIFNYYIMDKIQNANNLCKDLVKMDLDTYDKEFILKYSIFTKNETFRKKYTDELEISQDKTQNTYYLLGLSYLEANNIEKMNASFKMGYDNSKYLDKYNSKYFLENKNFNNIYKFLSDEWNTNGFTVDMFFNTKSLANDDFVNYMEKKLKEDSSDFNKIILGTLYYEKEKYSDAMELVENLQSLDNNISYELLLSSLYDKQDNPDKAQKIKGEIIAINYQNPFIHYILAKDAIINKNYGKAINEGIDSLDLESNCLNVYFDIFYNYYHDRNDTANEKTSLLESLFYDPFNAEIYNLLGMQYFNEKNFIKSIGYFKYACNLNNKVATYFSNLAKSYSQIGDTNSAIASLETSLRLEENDSELNDLSFEYIKNHDFNKAFSTLSKLYTKNPFDEVLKYKIAVTNCYLKKYNEALAFFNEIKSPIADSAYYKNNLIAAKYFLGELGKHETIDEMNLLLNSGIKEDLKNALIKNIESINSSKDVISLTFFFNY